MPNLFDFPATIIKLHDWSHEIQDRIDQISTLYTALKKAVDTGEGDPNTLVLTPGQIAVIEADMAVLEAEVIALCSAHNVEPVEIPDP